MRKNKHIWLIMAGALMILSLEKANAQQFNAGFFGGITACQVDGDLYSGFHKLGMTAGAFVNREIDYSIFWQLEIRYVSRGAYENFGPSVPTIDHAIYRIIEFPLSAHYLYEDKLQFELGLSPEVLISYLHFDENGRTDPSLDPENRRLGLSMFAGLYYWFLPSTGVAFRYTYSVLPFRKPEEWNFARYRGFFHNVLSLSLVYRIKHP